jgi:hypothetical protein
MTCMCYNNNTPFRKKYVTLQLVFVKLCIPQIYIYNLLKTYIQFSFHYFACLINVVKLVIFISAMRYLQDFEHISLLGNMLSIK